MGESNVPGTWICSENFYGSLDGCDCECGAHDPDCGSPNLSVYNCDSVQNCIEGVCIHTEYYYEEDEEPLKESGSAGFPFFVIPLSIGGIALALRAISALDCVQPTGGSVEIAAEVSAGANDSTPEIDVAQQVSLDNNQRALPQAAVVARDGLVIDTAVVDNSL